MKNLAPPQTLIKYQPSVEIYESMKAYHQSRNSHPSPTTSPKNQEVIDSMIPPRDWTDHHNKLHIQYVSHQPASRQDVQELTQHLNNMLDERQAKKTGVCPIREELYSQTFDQIIRQVAVDCPQRGLLLMRVRDEHKMTLAAYETIYQSSIGYGLRKQVESEEGSDAIEEEMNQLEEEYKQLQSRKTQLMFEKDLLEKEIRESRVLEGERRQEQLRFLRLQKDNMTKFLESVRTEFRLNY